MGVFEKRQTSALGIVICTILLLGPYLISVLWLPARCKLVAKVQAQDNSLSKSNTPEKSKVFAKRNNSPFLKCVK